MADTSIVEEWRPVVGYEGLYEISDRGRVRSAVLRSKTHPGKILKLWVVLGYRAVGLYKNGSRKRIYVHRLVALSFLGPCRPEASVVNHKNGVKGDNYPDNLEWCSPSENIKHAFAMGMQPSGDKHYFHLHPELVRRGELSNFSKLTEGQVQDIRRKILRGHRDLEIAGDTGMAQSTINGIRHNRTWRWLPWPCD